MNAMVRRSAPLALALLAAAGVALAAAPDSLSTPVFRGTFIAEDGQTTRISLPQGGAVAIQHAQSGERYLLTGRLLEDGQVELALDRYRNPGQKTPDASERLVVEVGGDAATSIAGFGLQISDIRWATRPAGKDTTSVAGPQAEAETCCVTCGGWRVCCTVSGGWCCEIESSCGSSCSAGPCEAQIE